MSTPVQADSKWENIPEDTSWVDNSLPSIHAAVCILYKCEARTKITVMFDTLRSKHIIQHGPNPEHVLLYKYPKNGYVSLDLDSIRTQDELPDGLISIDDWLVRVHEEALG